MRDPARPGPAELTDGISTDETRNHQQRDQHLLAAEAPVEQQPLEAQHEQRKRRVAQEADRDTRHPDRLEERDPVDCEHDAVVRKTGLGAEVPALDGNDEREDRGGDRRAAKHDRVRRQRQPLAEQSGDPEQGDRDVQRENGGERGGGHRGVGPRSSGGRAHSATTTRLESRRPAVRRRIRPVVANDAAG